MCLKKMLIAWSLSVLAVGVCINTISAKELELFGNPLHLYGYVKQNISYNVSAEDYYNEEDFNSAIMNILLEGSYEVAHNLAIYAAAGLTVDWIYDIKQDDDHGMRKNSTNPPTAISMTNTGKY